MLLNLLRIEDADPERMMQLSFHQFQNEKVSTQCTLHVVFPTVIKHSCHEFTLAQPCAEALAKRCQWQLRVHFSLPRNTLLALPCAHLLPPPHRGCCSHTHVQPVWQFTLTYSVVCILVCVAFVCARSTCVICALNGICARNA